MPKQLNNSIFSLRKTDISDKTSNEIRTVNFQNSEIKNPVIKAYFDSRIKFLSYSYEFAKSAKLEKDFDFSEKVETQVQMQNWLENNKQPETISNKSEIISGTEFGVITTKVIESISSIQKNTYLKELQKDLKLVIFKKLNPDFDEKYKEQKDKLKLSDEQKLRNENQIKLAADLKIFKVSKEDLLGLSNIDIKQVFKYELIEKAKNISDLLLELQKYEILSDKISSSIVYLNEFHSRANQAWNSAFELVRNVIENPKEAITHPKIKNSEVDLVEFYILKLYFAFDLEIRKIENDVLNILNEELNQIKQEFATEFIASDQANDLNEPQRQELNSKLQNIWLFDWTKAESVVKFIAKVGFLLEETKASEEEMQKTQKGRRKGVKQEKPQKIDSAKSDFSLRHPKSAPSFPSLKEKVINWDINQSTSYILSENQQNFDSLKFADYLLFRLKKIIENSDVYKVWRHLYASGDFEWVKWIESILNSEVLDFSGFEIAGIAQKTPDKTLNGFDKILFKKLDGTFDPICYIENQKIRFLNFVYSDGRLNDRLPKITFKLLKKGVASQINLQKWLETHYLDLSKFNIEIALVRELVSQNLFDRTFVKNWTNLLTDEQKMQEKLATRTEKRLETLKKLKLEPDFQIEKTINVLTEKLNKLETHLLLDQNHSEYKVFDKASFDKYKNLSQVIFETCFRDKKNIVNAKSDLAKLTLDVAQVLPIKISRMTSDKSNGKSTLIYEIDATNFAMKKEVDPEVLIYLVNMRLTGGIEVKIVDSLEKALKEFNLQPQKYQKICAGFLNGNADNHSDKTVNSVLKKDGSDGQYTEFGKWKLRDTRSLGELNISVEDSYRAAGETVAGKNPPGYPQIYFFLIPKVCNNLIVPVKTSSYYLGKYTPYNHLKKYLNLEIALFEAQKDSDQNKIKEKIAEILALRTKLRSFYKLSSIELDLIRDYKLVIDKTTRKAAIEPIVKAKIHFQFGNPRKVYDRTKAEIRPKYVVSVDLGEKHLAVATLSKINWDKWDKADFKATNDKENYILKPVSSSYLPLSSGELALFIDKNTNTDPEKDRFWTKYTDIIHRYKSQQKQFGVVQSELASAKMNLTKKLAEQIAVQIVKVAYKNRAIVIFEDLSAGFGRRVETVRLYTQIRRLTAQKLGEVGLLDTSFVRSEADLDKFTSYEYSKGLFSIINPSYTSKTCSCCGFTPVIEKTDKNGVIVSEGVKMNTSNWTDQHKIEFIWKQQVFYTVVAPTKEIKTWEILDASLKNISHDFKSRLVFSKNRKSRPVLEAIQEWLFTTKEQKHKEKIDAGFLKFAMNSLFRPRQSQSDYDCPICRNQQNADYQASYNIGLHFMIGLKIVQERQASGLKSDLRKGIVEEIRKRLNYN